MSTDTFTLPRRALVERDETVPPRELVGASDSAAAPRRAKSGFRARFLSVLTHHDRRPTNDHALFLGPNGGPIWTTRVR